jgi:hypothetical protein
VTGRYGTTRWLAMPALLLALLVPARAIAFCCLGVAGPAAAAGAHATHGPTPHHRSDGEPKPIGQTLGPAAESACVGMTTSAPALRERGRSGEAAPGAGDPAIAPVARVRDLGPPPRLAPLPLAPVSHPVGEEILYSLRL